MVNMSQHSVENHVLPSLKNSLFKAIEEGDQEEFEKICRDNADVIQECFFTIWRKKPTELTNNEEQSLWYNNCLLQIAVFYDESLDRPKLLASLRTPELKHYKGEQLFFTTMTYVKDLMEWLEYERAIDILSDLLSSDSPDLDEHRSLIWGWLGECCFQSGRVKDSILPMIKALEISKKKNDMNGIILYHTNLIEVYRYLGDAEMAAMWCDKTADIYRDINRFDECITFTKCAKVIRKGEPLNRMIVHIDNTVYELDEISSELSKSTFNTSIKFVFQRNRITLLPCSELVRRGRSFGQKGYYHEALECFQLAHEMDPYSPEPKYDEALTMMLLGRYREGLNAYLATEKLAPGWYKVRAYIWLAQAMVDGKLDHHAFESIRILEDSPMEDSQKVQLAEMMLQQYSSVAYFNLLYGLSLSRLGEKSQALSTFREGLENGGGDIE